MVIKEYLFFRAETGSTGNYNPKYFMPHLYSIDFLTKPIEHNGETFIPIVELGKIAYPLEDFELSERGKKAISSRFDFEFYKDGFIAYNYISDCRIDVPNQYQLFQKLAEWHINFNGIPEGLYIDKQTLK